jgi:hypothetical protein
MRQEGLQIGGKDLWSNSDRTLNFDDISRSSLDTDI